MKPELTRFLRGFGFAWQGLCGAVRQERNFRFHCVAALYVLAAGLLCRLDAAGWALLWLCIGGVMALELVNTAVERAVDAPDAAHWAAAGAAKDCGAAAVLVFSGAAVAVAICLFVLSGAWRTGWQRLQAYPPVGVLLLLGLVPGYRFVFRYGCRGSKRKADITKENESKP